MTPPQGLHRPIQNIFSEYGHVAYQIKGYEVNNSLLANILPLHKHLTPGVRSKCHLFFSFLKVVVLHIKLTRKGHRRGSQWGTSEIANQ